MNDDFQDGSGLMEKTDRHLPGGLTKTTQNISQYSRCSDRDSKRAPPGYKSAPLRVNEAFRRVRIARSLCSCTYTYVAHGPVPFPVWQFCYFTRKRWGIQKYYCFHLRSKLGRGTRSITSYEAQEIDLLFTKLFPILAHTEHLKLLYQCSTC
jgi:hypothetical protein